MKRILIILALFLGNLCLYGQDFALKTNVVNDALLNIIPGEPPAGSLNRYAVVLVKYHSGTCNHRILVRQGYEPDIVTENLTTIQDAGSQNGTKPAYWHAFNLRTGVLTASSPVDEGSMFRYDNISVAVDATSNTEEAKYLPASMVPLWIIKNGQAAQLGKWSDVKDMYPTYSSDGKGYPGNSNFPMKNFNRELTVSYQGNGTVKAEVPHIEDWMAMRDDPKCEYAFGVLYGDNATDVHMIDAFDNIYSMPERDGHGMRGAFVYNTETSHNVFFPSGATGFGRRQADKGVSGAERSTEAGILRYAGRKGYMQSALAEKMPPFWDIFHHAGALYWVQPKNSTLIDVWGDNEGNQAKVGNVAQWDINCSSFDFNFYGASNSMKNHSDAAYIRLVERAPRSKAARRNKPIRR